MHIFSIANHLIRLGLDCVVCIPDKPETVYAHGTPRFKVLDYSAAKQNGVTFSNGRGPDLIHAWTPRELVRKITQTLAARYRCPYLVHMEDNEEAILENELPYDPSRNPGDPRPPIVYSIMPEWRIHPLHYREFLANAVGMTAVMDRLLEFKPSHVPGVVFWPGYDEDFLQLPASSEDLRRRYGITSDEHVAVYTGNIHASNRKEVRSLYLAVGLLNRRGVPLKIVKTGWNYEDPLGNELQELKAHVVDLGFVPRKDVPSIVAMADVLIQPGGPDKFNDYRFPSKLPEYLVSGKPVILPKTNIGRYILDGVEGILLHEGHAVEIAEKVERLLGGKELREKVGQGGREFALRELQWAKNVGIIRDFYDHLMRTSDAESVLLQPNERSDGRGIEERGGGAKVVPGIKQATAAARRPASENAVKLIAFYLPQFYPIKENDEWWGKGFTEWRSVVKAKPNFLGHYQPHLPADLGFYDLRVPEVMEQQAQLARTYGISGFCFYFYWFNGLRLLERPLEQMLKNDHFSFPFCLCWANENWTRRWDGAEHEVLVRQEHSPRSDAAFIRDVIPLLKDHRYMKVQGKPILLVYRINLFPDPTNTARIWRDICAGEGIPAIHLCAVQSFGITDPRPYGFDAAVEFPPHTERSLINPKRMPGLAPDFEGYIEDYLQVASTKMKEPPTEYIRYRGIMPAWDNTPRRGKRAHILVNESPAAYEEWLRVLVLQARENPLVQEPLIFINAWNEWAEGTHLEPDEKHGYAYLEATRRALSHSSF